ncbi:MAG: exo-alpha-sialidase [Bacteroidetes bacterium]|nr:exo-alpha-sialidase [Bacteroidota bacterium]MBU1115490.1 exo-alpha-sialidase [Bacteroidota bacterium]MBU1798167.1 exo-alpha-sialidase [Bacteroidota bacterium]
MGKLILFVLLNVSVLFSYNNSTLLNNEFNIPRWFSAQDTSKNLLTAANPIFKDNNLYLIYVSSSEFADSIFTIKSSDYGKKWANKTLVKEINKESESNYLTLSSLLLSSGRIILTYSVMSGLSATSTQYIYSDDLVSWSAPQFIVSSGVKINQPQIKQSENGRIWISGRSGYLFYSDDDGSSWSPKNIDFNAHDIVTIGDSTILAYSIESSIEIILRRSFNFGESWSIPESIFASSKKISNLTVSSSVDSTWLSFNIEESTIFQDINRTTIKYIKMDKNVTNYTDPILFTNYMGNDTKFKTTILEGKPFFTFLTDRKYGVYQNWFCTIGNSTINEMSYPTIYKYNLSEIKLNTPIRIEVFVNNSTEIDGCKLILTDNTISEEILLNDSAMDEDLTAGDNIYSGGFKIFEYGKEYFLTIIINDIEKNILTYPLNKIVYNQPVEYEWLNVGSFHNWYSSIGNEREVEHSNATGSLYGWQWPGYYPNQDMQAAKGLWIGCRNYTDPNANNTKFDYKVVHCGPRPQTGGSSEFFPVEFKHYAKYHPTEVRVDGALSNYPGQQVTIDELDPSMPYDQMLYNYVNTELGMSMKRKIYQFSNPYYDNFHVIEYTFINNGNIDGDSEIERTSGDLEDVYFYFQKRLSFVRETRMLFGDQTSWGANTLNNEVGPYPSGGNEDLRYSYAWHGYWDRFNEYNSLGGPIWHPDLGYGARINDADTVGRLGAAQFSGALTLFAQNGTDPMIDDTNQPSTTGYESSDDELQYYSDTYNVSQMQARYNLMVKGHPEQSHADWITGSDYVNSTIVGGNQSINKSGYSYVNGYGPYQVAYGDSVKLIIVEGSAGLSRDEAIRIGKMFKSGAISVSDKNIAVLTGQDSLHVSFERVMDAFKNGWNVPQAPYPPKSFNVNSRPSSIDLSWTPNEDGPAIKGYEIYRNTIEQVDGYVSNQYYSKYTKIAELPADVNVFSDTTQENGKNYYYYIVTVGENQPANSSLNIPSYVLKSNRSYTQSYLPAMKTNPNSIKPNGEIPNKLELFQNYPNPFNPSTSIHYQIPNDGYVKLSIYNITGSRVATLFEKYQKSGEYKIKYDASSLSSGIYFYRLEYFSNESRETISRAMKMILLK